MGEAPSKVGPKVVRQIERSEPPAAHTASKSQAGHETCPFSERTGAVRSGEGM